MDTKFQTSFIPKKSSIVEQKTTKHGKGTNVFTFLATLIFILSLAGAAYTILWKGVLLKEQEGLKNALAKAEADLNRDDIDLLRRTSAKLELGKKILENHVAVSEVFDILNTLTIQSIKFDKFTFEGNTAGTGVQIELEGRGNNFTSVAYQSDVFGQSEKFSGNRVIRNPIIADLKINESGSIGFKFTADIEVKDISYEKSLGIPSENLTQ